MSDERIVRRSLNDLPEPFDRARYDAITDEDIVRGIEADPDAAPLLDEGWLAAARRVEPQVKVAISLRVDRDVLDFFKAKGEGYQTRMNGVLRAFMEYERRRG